MGQIMKLIILRKTENGEEEEEKIENAIATSFSEAFAKEVVSFRITEHFW